MGWKKRVSGWLSGPAQTPRPARGRRSVESVAGEPAPRRELRSMANLDAASLARPLHADRQRQIVERVGERIERGALDLPPLPASGVSLIELAGTSQADVDDLVQHIEKDPVLSSELLRLANSVLYAAPSPAKTIREAVMRVGLRALRTLVLGLSMRGTILRSRGVRQYADEIWRQSFSVASLARVLGPKAGVDSDEAFVLGLLHDVGKVSVLATLARELEQDEPAPPELIGRLFRSFHESAGREMARKWRLSEELQAVAGQHHDYRNNETSPRAAALVCIAHKMDLFLSMGALREYRALRKSDPFRFLGVDDVRAATLLEEGLEAFELTHANPEGSAEAA